MSIDVSIKSEGMEEAEALIAQIQKIAGSVYLYSDSRAESSRTNDEVLEHLQSIGKDYVRISGAEKEAVAKEYTKVFDAELQNVLDSGKPMSDSDRKKAEKVALTAAMKLRMGQVAEKVHAGGSVRTGQLLENLRNFGNIRFK